MATLPSRLLRIASRRKPPPSRIRTISSRVTTIRSRVEAQKSRDTPPETGSLAFNWHPCRAGHHHGRPAEKTHNPLKCRDKCGSHRPAASIFPEHRSPETVCTTTQSRRFGGVRCRWLRDARDCGGSPAVPSPRPDRRSGSGSRLPAVVAGEFRKPPGTRLPKPGTATMVRRVLAPGAVLLGWWSRAFASCGSDETRSLHSWGSECKRPPSRAISEPRCRCSSAGRARHS